MIKINYNYLAQIYFTALQLLTGARDTHFGRQPPDHLWRQIHVSRLQKPVPWPFSPWRARETGDENELRMLICDLQEVKFYFFNFWTTLTMSGDVQARKRKGKNKKNKGKFVVGDTFIFFNHTLLLELIDRYVFDKYRGMAISFLQNYACNIKVS